MSRPLYMEDLRHSREGRSRRDRSAKDLFRTGPFRDSQLKPGLFKDTLNTTVPLPEDRFREDPFRSARPSKSRRLRRLSFRSKLS